MKILLLLSQFIFVFAHAQTDVSDKFSVTKADLLSYRDELVPIEIENANLNNQKFVPLAICAPDLQNFSSQKQAEKMARDVGGIILMMNDGKSLSFIRYYNLFSMGPGFVYLNDLHGRSAHNELDWISIGLIGVKEVTLAPDTFRVTSKYFSIDASSSGTARIKSRWAGRGDPMNRLTYFCKWQRDMNYHSNR